MGTASSLIEMRAAMERDDLERAAALVPRVLEEDRSGRAMHLAALVQVRSGHMISGTALLEQAVQASPDQACWHRDLGTVRLSLGEGHAAAQAFRMALDVNPRDARAWRGLAKALTLNEQPEAAFLALSRSLEFEPHSVTALKAIAENLRRRGLTGEAVSHEEQLLRLHPNDPEAAARLALDYWKLGDLRRALTSSELVINQGAASPAFHSAYLYLLLFDPARKGTDLRAAYEEWAARYCSSCVIPGVLRNLDPDRRLRVGYLSAELRGGPPLFFLLPILAGHDARQVEVFVYHAAARSDESTECFRQHADYWRDCHHLTDVELEETICNDRIDILVNPSGYSREHRLNIPAQRVAPIQVNYPNYPSTQGIPQVDYILTDRWATPVGTEAEYTERPLRLPSGYLAYAPPTDAPALTALPAEANGFVTYGLFQRRVKLNDEVLDTVAEVLRRAPGSQLLIQHADPTLDRPDSPNRLSLMSEFLRRGVGPDRLRFAGSRTRTQLMALMAEVDVALDSFPFAGQTTTCECLWMGVPVVTLAGQTHTSRVGASILGCVGLAEFVTGSAGHYVETAVGVGADRTRLSTLRRGMRERLQESGFTGSRRLSQEIEACFRELWRNWCRENK